MLSPDVTVTVALASLLLLFAGLLGRLDLGAAIRPRRGAEAAAVSARRWPRGR
jgi:hypothetical protein